MDRAINSHHDDGNLINVYHFRLLQNHLELGVGHQLIGICVH